MRTTEPSRRPLSRSRRGSNAVEFALCLPLLVAILGGITEYGVMFYEYLSVQSATRDGARWGASQGVSAYDASAQAVTQVRESLSMLGKTCTEADEVAGTCEITATLDTVDGLVRVEVNTALDYRPIWGGLVPVPTRLGSMSTFVLVDQDTGAL